MGHASWGVLRSSLRRRFGKIHNGSAQGRQTTSRDDQVGDDKVGVQKSLGLSPIIPSRRKVGPRSPGTKTGQKTTARHT
jgi:hypothetical protein